MFVDHIKMHAKAGDGGNGKVSFRRAKFIPKGGPDGGDGGNGGDVILQVDHHTDNLKEFFYQRMQKAQPGVHGGANQRTGKSGKALVLKVPQGTVVYRATPPKEVRSAEIEDENCDVFVPMEDPDSELVDAVDGDEAVAAEDADELEAESADPNVGHLEGEDGEELEMLVDLAEPDQRFLLCKGGIGGKGNTHFKSSTNQTPIEAVPGTPGEEGWFYFELRKIADAGLVGFPNAGKSTLLRALSAAKPKVAAYPFTTLKPMVGVVELDGYRRATVADIPGLIEGAHANVGLGHEFLRHITRCRLLLFVVDLAAVDGRDPVSDIQLLRTEVKLYDEELSTRPWVIVANKIDLPESEEALKVLRARFPKIEILPICAESGEGVEALRERLMEVSHKRFD
jgi:GTP-binding protein